MSGDQAVPLPDEAVEAAFQAWFGEHMRGQIVSDLYQDDLRQAFTDARKMAITRIWNEAQASERKLTAKLLRRAADVDDPRFTAFDADRNTLRGVADLLDQDGPAATGGGK